MRKSPFKRGDVLGSLTVVDVVGVGPRGHIWRCTCACGGEAHRTAQAIRRSPHPRCDACMPARGRPFSKRAEPKPVKSPLPPPPCPLSCRPLGVARACWLVDDVLAWQRANLPPGGAHRIVLGDVAPQASDFKTFPAWWIHRRAGGECREMVERYWHPEGGGCIARPRRTNNVRELFPRAHVLSADQPTDGGLPSWKGA